MAYNADEWLNSVERPTITIAGKTHVGRLLSFQEFLPFSVQIETIAPKEQGADFLAFAEAYMKAVFPPKKYITWKPSVASQIMAVHSLGHVYR